MGATSKTLPFYRVRVFVPWWLDFLLDDAIPMNSDRRSMQLLEGGLSGLFSDLLVWLRLQEKGVIMHEITSRPIEPAKFEQVPRVVGFDRIRADFPAYLSDESGLSPKPFDYLFFPRSEGELAAVVRELAARGTTVTVAGARTGVVGGCVPMGGALVSLENLNRTLDLYHVPSANEWRVRTQCALTLKDLNQMVTRKRFPKLERNADERTRAALVQFREDRESYFYPPDPTETTASLGGTMATNASGARTYRYGPTRAWVRGIRVLLVNGEFLDIPRSKYFASPSGEFLVYDSSGRGVAVSIPDYPLPRTKSAAGVFSAPQMDLVDLFVGSEGSFGIITAGDVALHRYERRTAVAQFVPSDAHALALVEHLRSDTRLKLDSLEFLSENAIALLRFKQAQDPRGLHLPPIPQGAALLLEVARGPEAQSPGLDVLEEMVEACGANPEESWAAQTSRELARLKSFRHLLPETINRIIAQRKAEHPSLHKVAADLAVPDGHLGDLWRLYVSSLDGAGLEWAVFGHIGNSHLHVNILPKNVEELERGMEFCSSFARKAVQLGGTISGEHGIGKVKSLHLSAMYSDEQIDQMRRIKDAFDPDWILNPGNIFGD